MNYLHQATEPSRRLGVEMDLIARNLTFLTNRYPVLPMGRRTLVLTDQKTDVVLGSGRWATIPYRPEVGGCAVMRTRLRLPGLTPDTRHHEASIESEDPWAWQSGISAASDAMVTWIISAVMSKKNVTYNHLAAELNTDDETASLDSFRTSGLGAHCYPTEAYFAQDVCTYLSQWWTVESEVDGELNGEEVRIDAILTNRKDPSLVVGVEFKHPHGQTNALRGLTQASRYRRAAFDGHGRIPIAYCCPGQVPSGHEAQYVQDRLKVGLLDFDGSWSLTSREFSWSEHVGLLTRVNSRRPPTQKGKP